MPKDRGAAAQAVFTPGPWRVEPCELETSIGQRFCGKWLVSGPSNSDGRFSEADARLIAAAPDLYEALAEALGEADECRPRKSPEAGIIPRPHFMWREKARAALAKAEGRSAPQAPPENAAQRVPSSQERPCKCGAKRLPPGVHAWVDDETNSGEFHSQGICVPPPQKDGRLRSVREPLLTGTSAPAGQGEGNLAGFTPETAPPKESP